MKRTKWALLLLSTLLLGLCLGVVGSGFLIKYRFDEVAREGPDAIPGILTRQLARRLDLTSPQQEIIEPILRSAQREFQSVRRQYEPQIQHIIAQATAAIRATLTEEQAGRFEAVLEFQRSRWLATHGAEPAADSE